MESPPKWYKRLKFLDSDSDKKKHCNPWLRFNLCLCEWPKISVSYWHYNSYAINKGFYQLIYSLFLSFLCSCRNVNVPLFSAYESHTAHTSSNFIMFSLLVWFLSTYSLAKNLLVPHSLFYSSQLKNWNCTHSLTMKHLYFLHVPTIFNHFWNSVIPIKI